jgi:hypothetical protein
VCSSGRPFWPLWAYERSPFTVGSSRLWWWTDFMIELKDAVVHRSKSFVNIGIGFIMTCMDRQLHHLPPKQVHNTLRPPPQTLRLRLVAPRRTNLRTLQSRNASRAPRQHRQRCLHRSVRSTSSREPSAGHGPSTGVLRRRSRHRLPVAPWP